MTECVDYDENCDWWMRNGECHLNQAWMHFYCRKSCTNCADDYTGDICEYLLFLAAQQLTDTFQLFEVAAPRTKISGKNWSSSRVASGGSSSCRRRGRKLLRWGRQLNIFYRFSENLMKLKKFWSAGGAPGELP